MNRDGIKWAFALVKSAKKEISASRWAGKDITGMTPIFISEQMYPERVRFILKLNPLAYMVRAYRERLLTSQMPDVHELAVLAGFGVASFAIGGLFFRHLKRGFADVL